MARLHRNAQGWQDIKIKLQSHTASENWPSTDLQCAVCDLETLFAENEALKAANKDLQLHFDVLMEDFETASVEVDLWRHVAGEMSEAIEAYENCTPRYDWNLGLSDALERYRRFNQGR